MLRVGFGYDVHTFAAGRQLWLGGVNIPHELGLLGHSDADVLLHALCDALLGAAGLRDIGHQFPNTDPNFAGIDSKILLAHTYALVQQQGYQVLNLDCTVVAEQPKLQPHLSAMQAAIASGLSGSLQPEGISIKATTNEGMGFVGRKEGIAAYAVVLLVRNELYKVLTQELSPTAG